MDTRSDVDPKVREREIKKREANKGKGKGPSDGNAVNYRLAPDFENAGLAIVVKNSLMDALKDVKQIHRRIMKITFEAQGADISFLSVYAPHSTHDTETKEAFYDTLSDEVSRTKGIYYVGGDFNARIHHVRESDKEVCGPHILGRGLGYLNIMNDSTKESRSPFLGFAKIHHLKVMNSLFHKPVEKLITYKCKVQNEESLENGPPYDAVNYAQIDFWLAGDGWKKTVLDVQSRKELFFETDHFVLEARLSVSAFNYRPNDRESTKKCLKPDSDRWRTYNEYVRNYFVTHPITLKGFTSAMQESAEKFLERIPKDRKKPYISRQTWNKIEERNNKRRLGASVGEMKQRNNDFAKSAKLDKQQVLIEKFVESTQDKHKKTYVEGCKRAKEKIHPAVRQNEEQNGHACASNKKG